MSSASGAGAPMPAAGAPLAGPAGKGKGGAGGEEERQLQSQEAQRNLSEDLSEKYLVRLKEETLQRKNLIINRRLKNQFSNGL